MSQGDELNQTIEEIAQGGPGIAGPGSSIKHPYDELDRWLLAALQRLGAIDAAAFAANRSVQTSGAADPALTAPQVEAWLRSASRRGLLTPQTVDLGGGPIHPPVWFLSDAGRERLRATRTPIDRIPVKRWRQGAVRLRRHLPGGRPSWNAVLAALAESDVQWDDRPLPPDRHPRPIVKASVAADDAEADRLLQERVGRIVVLMLENRSFDHMLGYLRLQGNKEVEGLTGGSEQFNEHQGRRYAPRRLASTRLPKNLDPGHSIAEVADQLEVENGRPNAGFVRNFATLEPEQPELVMGYHDGSQLPVYDYLAHNACICDHWFSSVPGSTWVNRLFALCGRADAEQEGILDGPLWDIPSFPRHLDAAGAEWRWYSHDPATLRVADGEYRNPLKGLRPENFRYFNRRMVSDMEQADDGLRVREDGSFLDHARSGKLPPVSWIDPNFIDLSFTDRNSNDDHPPSDVRAAQALVLTVLRAIAEGPVEQLSKRS